MNIAIVAIIISALSLILSSIGATARAVKAQQNQTHAVQQEVIGKVIVMVASGWSEWPTYPQCETNAEGRFTNVPCAYGNRNYEPHAAEPAEEEVPSWLWTISR